MILIIDSFSFLKEEKRKESTYFIPLEKLYDQGCRILSGFVPESDLKEYPVWGLRLRHDFNCDISGIPMFRGLLALRSLHTNTHVIFSATYDLSHILYDEGGFVSIYDSVKEKVVSTIEDAICLEYNGIIMIGIPHVVDNRYTYQLFSLVFEKDIIKYIYKFSILIDRWDYCSYRGVYLLFNSVYLKELNKTYNDKFFIGRIGYLSNGNFFSIKKLMFDVELAQKAIETAHLNENNVFANTGIGGY